MKESLIYEEKIWPCIVAQVEMLIKGHPQAFDFFEFSKHIIFNKYYDLRDSFKLRYMVSLDDYESVDSIVCDRHKIGAAYMIAILTSSPVVLRPELQLRNADFKFLFNEHIAIRVGMSIVAS